MLDTRNYLFNKKKNQKEKDKMSIRSYQKPHRQNTSTYDPSYSSDLIWILVLLTPG